MKPQEQLYQELRQRILALSGVRERPNAGIHEDAFFVREKMFMHIHGHGQCDIRLAKADQERVLAEAKCVRTAGRLRRSHHLYGAQRKGFRAGNELIRTVTRTFCRRSKLMKNSILFLSIICGSGLTMVSIYNTVVDAKSWSSDIQPSFKTARDYFQHVDPRRFYQVAGPVNLILIVLTFIVFWKDSPARYYFAPSFARYAAIVLLRLVYFIPRDLILFTWSIPDHLEQIRAASSQWSAMNWFRSLLGLVGVLFSFKGLDTYYATRSKKR